MAPRGARGGKFKPSRGGGKHFSRDLQPLDKDGNALGLWREPGEQVPSSGDEESSSEESSEESSDEGTGPSTSTPANTAELTREERRNQAKAKKLAALAKRNKTAAQVGDLPPSDSDASEDEALPANPNHTAQSRKQLVKEEVDEDAPKPKKVVKDASQLSRREREALQAQQARERYLKLHAEGKTDEARSDLARLAIIREKREAERARKEAEQEEKDEQAKEREAAIQAREEKLRAAALGGKPSKKGGRK
ncbi:hypothetical protein N7466_006219 [Penicillium verhagenii]|uniref:uncharacterized protein n=1 Tax=Penicillium verhagenii TaxID=1562060 RepID=UPI0025456306|nr:uncharacterized protein N7466_006219 [Penicillium verhagenii]KAJ5930726.1 hypothetical protein N7466_006219 [Penicillium verhagenii]